MMFFSPHGLLRTTPHSKHHHLDRPLPSLIARARNYLATLAEHVANGSKLVPLQIVEERRGECEPCPHRNRQHDACSICGCPVGQDIESKIHWAVSRCPDNRWTSWDESTPHHWDLKPDSDINWTKQLLLQPPGPWPAGFEGYPSVNQAFSELLKEHSEKPPEPPEWKHEQGIVICGGGWRFFPSIYVTVRAIRHLNIDLPIQVWYMGDKNEFDIRMKQALDPYNVGWIDANSFHRENPHTGIRRPIDHGWQLKPYAACYAPFREVIALDADSFPVRPLSHILDHPEYKRVGACFFPDHNPLDPGQWTRFGLPPCGLPGLESGQFIVDKGRHWRPLWLARFMNDFYEYVWNLDSLGLKGHLYGDKDTFAIAWQRCGHEMCVPTRQPGFRKGAFLQKGFDDGIQFTHYTRNKFKFFGPIDGRDPERWYHTAQDQPPEEFGKKNGIPLYQEACQWAVECDQLLRPEAHFEFIGGARGWCRDIWDAVNLRDEYETGPKLHGIVIDLGANVGAFSHWAACRGASKILAVEPWAENIELLKKNTARHASKIEIIPAAAWREAKAIELSSHDEHIEGNTSTISVSGTRPDKRFVKAVTLDSIIGASTIELLKIDIEGAEGPVLEASQRLRQVKKIAGETHENFHCEGKEWTWEKIDAILERNGYKRKWFKNGPRTYLFWAERP